MRSFLSMLSMVTHRRPMSASCLSPFSPGRSVCLVAALISTIAACDPQVGDDYAGEPLAELGGTISVAEGTTAPADATATLVWHVWVEGDSASVTDEVPVDGAFPASFELSLFTPPPEHAWFDLASEDEAFAGMHVATGYVVVLPPDYPSTDMQKIFEDALGVDNDHLLVWSDSSVPESFNGGLFPGGLQPGYQLFQVVPPDNTAADACSDEVLACEEACLEQSPEMLDACINACPDMEDCPPWIGNDALVPVAMDSEISIVLGGEKREPDWF